MAGDVMATITTSEADEEPSLKSAPAVSSATVGQMVPE
jgi:hypothetical protein